MTEEQKKSSIKEFNFFKGILVASVSGIFSACFALGLDAAEPIARLSAGHGTTFIWTGLPKLCVVLLGVHLERPLVFLPQPQESHGLPVFPRPAAGGAAVPAGAAALEAAADPGRRRRR